METVCELDVDDDSSLSSEEEAEMSEPTWLAADLGAASDLSPQSRGERMRHSPQNTHSKEDDGATLFRSGPSTASQSRPASVLSSPARSSRETSDPLRSLDPPTPPPSAREAPVYCRAEQSARPPFPGASRSVER
eukprot:superscaffoldBa00003724_g17566